VIFNTKYLNDKFKDYSNLHSKIETEILSGRLIRICRNLYSDNTNEDIKKIANAIIRPSYISFDYALSFYGLIPERVYLITSAITGKHKSKQYKTPFGLYRYQNIPIICFPFGVTTIENGVQIASKEKALADFLYTLKPVSSLKILKNLLFVDLRIDIYEFNKLSKKDLRFLLPKYKCKNTNLLLKMIGDNDEQQIN
jgi:hypothetical protein